jgi:hypothetical protein
LLKCTQCNPQTLAFLAFQVIQSLFWLVAYFWHFARAALAVLLDPDLKDWAMHPTVANCCCGGCGNGDNDLAVAMDYHTSASTAQSYAAGDGSECQVPLCFVMTEPVMAANGSLLKEVKEEEC